MDLFTKLVETRESAPKLKVKKVYIDEDPNTEEKSPCPKCWSENRHSYVRYLFLNLQDAIYKCEDANCMYPFQNFKFKSYAERKVYCIEPVLEEPIGTPVLSDDFFSSLPVNLSPVKPEPHSSLTGGGSLMHFNLDFLSPDRNRSKAVPCRKTPDKGDINIFDSPSLSYTSLVKDFDTAFIDDILQEIGQGSVAEKKQKSPVFKAPLPTRPPTAGRQLKRCLKIFENKNFNQPTENEESTFKIPRLPGGESVSSTEIKRNKSPSTKKRKKSHSESNRSSSGSIVENLKPLVTQSITAMKQEASTITQDIRVIDTPPNAQTSKAGTNQLAKNLKVERMLNFIERSMKNKKLPEPINVQPLRPKPKKQKPKRKKCNLSDKVMKFHRRYNLSAAAAVLQDSDFEYSTTDDDEEESTTTNDDTDSFDIDGNDGTDNDYPHTESSNESNTSSVLPAENQTSVNSLPSFNDLFNSIHKMDPIAGFPQLQQQQQQQQPALLLSKSAGCSPIRMVPAADSEQWMHTPPRRIHSMESLISLLD
ncbi:uncharacterized protein LOC129746559 [Uranotaenia lowii]|uniref:uncharacterized protein LOC129746559 n=1 Tax=Uranotaenia lowii TaxID=190385 RepID=UPI002479D80E|nr:uncharacterized protein LOC129746559 [Uranotaenia lowii]